MSTLLFLAALATLGGYVCRIDAMSWRDHRPGPILLHLALGVCSAWVLTQAAQGRASWPEVFGLALSAGWLALSFSDWRNGPPAQVTKDRPAFHATRIRPDDLRRVSGGCGKK